MKAKFVPLNKNFIDYPIAHRGLHSSTISENSMLAFSQAIEANVAIEIDVHRLSDGNFAVCHDKNLKRVTGEGVLLSTLTKETLNSYKLKDGQSIPLLEDVLSLINGRVPLLVELKPENGFKKCDVEPLLNILYRYNHNDKIALQTFNPFLVRDVKKKTSIFSVGLLCSYDLGKMPKLENYIAKSLKLFNYSKADFISYDINYLPNKYVNKFKNKGTTILTWVVNSNEKLIKAKEVADNIIFENLDTKSILNNNRGDL